MLGLLYHQDNKYHDLNERVFFNLDVNNFSCPLEFIIEGTKHR